VLAEIDELEQRLAAALERSPLRRSRTARRSSASSSRPTGERGAGRKVRCRRARQAAALDFDRALRRLRIDSEAPPVARDRLI
jgi:hypothetical protein